MNIGLSFEPPSFSSGYLSENGCKDERIRSDAWLVMIMDGVTITGGCIYSHSNTHCNVRKYVMCARVVESAVRCRAYNTLDRFGGYSYGSVTISDA